jgi:hypothetical protein
MSGLRIRKLTLIELLVVIAIVAVIVALVLPPVKWAASGSIRFPVRVLVFDAVRGIPIENAHVGIFRAPPLLDLKFLAGEPDTYDPKKFVRDDDVGTTDASGSVVIDYEFRTGANHERPTSHAHLRWAWVHVQADGYGGVVVPVRHESLPTKTLREQKELLVPVGLTLED